jgi:hypothetical protein
MELKDLKDLKELIDGGKWDKRLGKLFDSSLAFDVIVVSARESGAFEFLESAIKIRRESLGISEYSYREHVQVPWEQWDDQLGKVSDTELASKIGCSVAWVGTRRRVLKIPKFPKRGHPGHSVPKKVDWEKWDPLLGKMSDIAIARKAGCSYQLVGLRRKKLRIEKFSLKMQSQVTTTSEPQPE